jgi:16S rRNA processing protein RimM
MPEHAEGPAGSPAAGEPAFLAVGKVRRPHGVTGDVLVDVYTDFPERLKLNVILFAGPKLVPLTICRRRVHKDGLLLAFTGYTTPEQVGGFRNQILYSKAAEAAALPAGEYYHHELLGMTVVDESGRLLGVLTEIIRTGANDVYVVTDENQHELLLPAISEVILNVDLHKKTLLVHLLQGLVDEGDDA